MMTYVVTRIAQFKISALDKEMALAEIKSGKGTLINQQDVVNEQGQPQGRQSPAENIPYDQWPMWAKAMRQLSRPEDKGIGDVVARMIGDENSAAFAAWYEAKFKKKCGCKGRKALWNRLYPLP